MSEHLSSYVALGPALAPALARLRGPASSSTPSPPASSSSSSPHRSASRPSPSPPSGTSASTPSPPTASCAPWWARRSRPACAPHPGEPANPSPPPYCTSTATSRHEVPPRSSRSTTHSVAAPASSGGPTSWRGEPPLAQPDSRGLSPLSPAMPEDEITRSRFLLTDLTHRDPLVELQVRRRHHHARPDRRIHHHRNSHLPPQIRRRRHHRPMRHMESKLPPGPKVRPLGRQRQRRLERHEMCRYHRRRRPRRPLHRA